MRAGEGARGSVMGKRTLLEKRGGVCIAQGRLVGVGKDFLNPSAGQDDARNKGGGVFGRRLWGSVFGQGEDFYLIHRGQKLTWTFYVLSWSRKKDDKKRDGFRKKLRNLRRPA